jgi:hypothetical protein
MKRNVPFISNTEDDLHCLQAAFMIILKKFSPDLDMDWDEWSEITGFEEGKGTWPIAGLLWFIENGFNVKQVELFDYVAFIRDGAQYLLKHYGEEVGQWAIEHSNVPLEQKRAKLIIEKNAYENRQPTLDDIKEFIDQGYLIRAHVNAKKLNGKKGYFGHAVVVFDYDDEGFILHDPGLPPMPNRLVSFKDFEAAWADPDASAAELSAIKL